MEDLITGFVAVAVACILLVDLVAQIRISTIERKLDEIIGKLGQQ